MRYILILTLTALFFSGCSTENPLCTDNFCIEGEIFPRSELGDRDFEELPDTVDEAELLAIFRGEKPPPAESPLQEGRLLYGEVTDTDTDFNAVRELVIIGITVRSTDFKKYTINFEGWYAWEDIGYKDFVVVELDSDFEAETFTYDGQLWKNISERLIFEIKADDK